MFYQVIYMVLLLKNYTFPFGIVLTSSNVGFAQVTRVRQYQTKIGFFFWHCAHLIVTLHAFSNTNEAWYLTSTNN